VKAFLYRVVFLVIVVATLFGVTDVTLSHPSDANSSGKLSQVDVNDQRGVEQTLLTFPEWFLVHSPAEFASDIAKNPAHHFPFAAHIRQLWSSYFAVTAEHLRQNYPLNPGYHVMIIVIASSTTVEYGLRWAYENTFGRLSWALSSRNLSDEDRYAAAVAQEYVNFIRQEPWYLFDFNAKLKHLWSDVPALGPDMIRKWERRYALSTEYLLKAAYGTLIEKATRSAYAPAEMTTRVQVDHLSDQVSLGNSKLVRQLPDGSAILDLPRYFDFRIAATNLAKQGVHLIDVAGNNTVILVSIWVDKSYKPVHPRILFEQNLETMPGKKRVALLMPLRELSDFLVLAPERGILVEHVYDY
jgi:hypothetical protein